MGKYENWLNYAKNSSIVGWFFTWLDNYSFIHLEQLLKIIQKRFY